METETKLIFLKNTDKKWKFIRDFNVVIFKNLNFTKNIISAENPRKETLSRIFGNEIFRKKNLNLAIEFYNLSLSIMPLSKKLERSFCFSNRAQCLLGLNMEKYTLVDCEMALKLIKNHEKSWYRKIFVYTIKKDHAGNFLNFWKIICLSAIFGKIQFLIRALSLSKLLVRFEKILSKEKYWKKLQAKIRKKSPPILEILQKRVSCKIPSIPFSGKVSNVILFDLKKIHEVNFILTIFFLNNFFFFFCSNKPLKIKNFYSFCLIIRKNFLGNGSNFFFDPRRKIFSFALFFQTIFFQKSFK